MVGQRKPREFDESFPAEFFRIVFGDFPARPGQEIEVRCIAKNKPVTQRFLKSLADFRKLWPTLVRLNRKKFNIYFGVVPRDPKNHKPAQPIVLSCLWVDIDLIPGAKNAAQRNLAKAIVELQPSLIVNSGHGRHLYFRLRKPVHVDTDLAKKILRAVAGKVDGDLQSAESARLLRVPGTLNWKQAGNPARCRIVQLASSRRYSVAEVAGPLRFPRLTKGPSGQCEDYFDFFHHHVSNLSMTGNGQAMGVCPFHKDHNPSFSLRTRDGVWHCFGCGRSGSPISFSLMLELDSAEIPVPQHSRESKAIAIEGGGYVAWKRDRNSWRKLHVSDFTVEWKTENRVSDKIRLEDRVFEGVMVTREGERIPIRITNKEFCSNGLFYEVIIREGGSKVRISERSISYLRDASLFFSNAQILRTNMDFGFQNSDVFLTPSLEITSKGMHRVSETLVDLSGIEHASHLDLHWANQKEFKALLDHIGQDLLELQPHEVTFALVGLLGGAPLMHFMEDKTRYALWLVGPSGSGKSFITKLFQCFFGNFAVEGRVASWSSTTNALQYIGYFFKDCIFLIDDYKPGMIPEKGVAQFLQNYADSYGRSRLTADIKSRKDYFVRGFLLSTGEDMPSGHASLIARSLILSVTKRKANIQKGEQCLKMCSQYSAITARYIRFLLRLPNVEKRVRALYSKRHASFLEGIAREENAVRVARNLALNSTGFYWFTKFLKANHASLDIDHIRTEHRKYLLALRSEVLTMVKREQPGEVFVHTLMEGLTSGACHLQSPQHDETLRGRAYVGFRKEKKDPHVYLYPGEAMRFVRNQQTNLGQPFEWSSNAISKALRRMGALVWPEDSEDAGTRLRGPLGKTVRAWKVHRQYLEPEGGAGK